MSTTLTGIGLYTVRDAARYSGAQTREIRRWLFGYQFGKAEGRRRSAPLWTTQLSDWDAQEIGFNDLLELRIVKTFVAHGVHLSIIRAAIQNARALFNRSHPLVNQRLLTDGRRIFHEAALSTEEPLLTDLADLQVVIRSVIRPSLHAGIDFSPSGTALRWYPVPKQKIIVLDPELSFGKPVLAEYGIPVDAVARLFEVEKSKATVARIYNIPPSAVAAAVSFAGQRLAA